MMDTVTTTAIGTDNDGWEVAFDTGEFDKRLEQQEKDRVANQVNAYCGHCKILGVSEI